MTRTTRIPSDKLTLGQLARQVGLARTSVLHYEALGLLAPRGRSTAGYRLYGEAELERLRTIRRLREAGLALIDIRALLAPHGGSERQRPGPGELLEQRLLALCGVVEGIREQQRLLARLLAQPDFRDGQRSYDKAAWVALLERSGFDAAAMHKWHREFEAENPQGHGDFLKSLGLKAAEVNDIRRWSGRATGRLKAKR